MPELQTAGACRWLLEGSWLFSEQPENERNYSGHNDAGYEGEINSDVFAFDVNVAGEPAEPGEFAGKDKDDTGRGNYQPEGYQPFANFRH